MLIDGVVLAGGRSSRLGSVPKANLVFDQQSLLAHAIQAASMTRQTVVVGPVDPLSLPGGVLVTRESPPFGGPAAAVAAGLGALAASGAEPSDCILVLACDMPRVAAAAAALLERLPLDEGADGLIAVDHRQKLQPLAAVYRTERLAAAVNANPVDSLPMFRLIAGLNLTPVTVPAGSTEDIDTWADAARFGVSPTSYPRNATFGEYPRPQPATSGISQAGTREAAYREGVTMTERDEEDEMLRQWCEKLAEALDVAGLTVELKPLLGLAGRAAHGILRPAAPLTTFIVGYAAGLAAGSGKADSTAAIQSATDTAFQLVRDAAEHAQAREA